MIYYLSNIFELLRNQKYRLVKYTNVHISKIQINTQMMQLKIQHTHHKKSLEKQLHEGSNNILTRQQKREQDLSQHSSSSQSEQQISKTSSHLIDSKKAINDENSKNKAKKKQKIELKLENYYERTNISQQLFPLLIESQALPNLKNRLIQFVSSRMRFCQDRNYLSQVGNKATYLQRHIQQIKDLDRRDALEQLFADVHTHIISDIWEGQYDIVKKVVKEKQQRLKINEMRDSLQSKLQDMKNSLQLSVATDLKTSTAEELIVTAQDRQKYQTTKKAKASSFIKKIVQQKKQLQRKKMQRQMSQQKKRVQQQKREQQLQQAAKKQRHERIKGRHQQNRNLKQMELKQAEQRKKKFDCFLSEYKNQVPLYKQIQKRYQNKIIQRQNQRAERLLNQIKQERKPLKLDELVQHQNWYHKMRIKNQQRRSLDMKQEMERRKAQNVNYYKGKAHSFIQQESQTKEEQYVKKIQIRRKRQDYVNRILIKYKPRASSAKRRQLEDLQEKRKWSQRKRQQMDMKQKNRYEQGKKHFESLKQYNQRMRQQGRVVKTEKKTQISFQTSRTIQPRPNYRNYLQEIRQQDVRNGKKRHSMNYSTLLQKDPSSFAVCLTRLQESSKRKQQYIKQITHLPIQTYLLQRTSLNQNYLESARAKMALLNQLK